MTKSRYKTGTAVALILSCIALTAPAIAGVGSPESTRYADQAATYAKKGEAAAAIIQLKNAIRADGNNLTARVDLAQLYLQTGDAVAAEQELETARTRGFDETKLLLPLAQAYFGQGKFREIVTKLDATKLSGDASVNLLAVQSRAHMALREPEAARADVNRALSENPNASSALMADALLLRSTNKFAEAEAQVDKALARDPGQPEILLLKGELRQLRQDNAGAAKILDTLVARNPTFTRGYVARAMAKLARNETAGVAEDIALILSREPENPLGLYMQSYMLTRENKQKEAVRILAAHPQLLAGYAPANYLLASAAFADGRTDLALVYAQHYVEKVPSDVAGVRLLAAVHQKAGNSQKAVALLEPLAAQNPADNQLRIQLANAYLGVGRSEQAITLFQQGVAADPNNTQAQFALAVSQINSGAKEQGAAQLEQLLKTNPTFLQGNAVAVMMNLQDGNIDKALETAAAMIKADPNDPNGYNLQGTIYLAAKKPDAAATSFKTALAKDSKFTAATLNLARVAERRNDREDAKRWYAQTLAIDSANLTAFNGLADLALMEDDFAEAVRQVEAGIKRNPENPEPRLRLIGMSLDAKDNQRALIAARDFANAMPEDMQALEALGRAQMAVGDYTNGVASYRKVATRLPDSVEAQRRLAGALMRSAASGKGESTPQWSEARAILDHAVKTAPAYQPALTDRIALERETKGADAALALATKMAAEQPDSATRLLTLGDTQIAMDRPADAVTTYRRAWEKGKNSVTTRRLYEGLTRAKRTEEGATILASWIAQNPKDHDTRFLLASYYIDTGKYEDAIRETEAMEGALPDNPVLLNNLAWLYGQKGNPRAIEIGERAYWLAPRSADVMDTLGALYLAKGDTVKGVELLAKAHDRAPERSDISYRYATALEKKGEGVKAKGVLQKTLATKAGFSERPNAEALLKKLGG